MPTYVTLETICEVMTERKCITWKVFDEEENLLHYYAPPESTLARDSFNTLKSFIEQLSGTNYAIIRVYAPEFKMGRGGDTANTVFRYYFRLRPQKENREQNNEGNREQGNMNGSYLELFKEMQQMKLDFMQKEHDNRLKTLEEKLKEQKDEDKDYFSKVAKTIGKEMAKEWLKAEGYEIDAEGVPIKKNGITENTSSQNGTEKKAEPSADKKKEVDEAFRRTSEATVRVMKTAKQYGSNYSAVAESFEEIADMAEKNPLKLKELMDELKKKKSE